MPAAILSRLTRFRRFCVIGDPVPGLAHVGLLADGAQVQPGMAVDVHDCEPPLRIQPPGSMAATAAGWIEDLSPDEEAGMELWLQDIQTRITASPNANRVRRVYTVRPAAQVDRAENGTCIGRRFSCAGFVERCYAEGAGISLIASEATLPEVDLQALVDIWPMAQSPARGRFGLTGDGPWRVLLPAYLLHALGREQPRSAFVPQLAHRMFTPPASTP